MAINSSVLIRTVRLFPWPTPEWRDPLAFRKFLSSWRKALVAELTTLATDNIHRVASLYSSEMP